MKADMKNLEWVESRLTLPPAVLSIIEGEPKCAVGPDRPDATIQAVWKEQRVRFVAEIKNRSIPKMLREAMNQVKRLACPPELYPMVIMPYLSNEKLLQLEAEEISGVDMCGNGVLVVPEKMFVFRSGKKNLFPENQPIKNVYRGMNSLVARAFLSQPEFQKVKDIAVFLEQRGGKVVLSTVSKALKRLEDDLVISRADGQIRVIQPDVLLDKLSANYESPMAKNRLRGRCSLPVDELIRRMSGAGRGQKVLFSLTGAASAERYAVMGREPVVSIYTSMDPDELLGSQGIEMNKDLPFVNLEIIQTSDERVFFDIKPKDGTPYASPVQAYLELATGDKRQQDAAQQIRQGILSSLAEEQR